MQAIKTISTILCAIALTACASAPSTGPTLYDRVVIDVRTDSTIVIPTDTPKDVIENMRRRTVMLAKARIAKVGDIDVVEECGPGVVRLVHDISSAQIITNTTAKAGFFSSSAKTEREVAVSMTTDIVDCKTGRQIATDSDTQDGEDIVSVLSDLVHDSVSMLYKKRRAPV